MTDSVQRIRVVGSIVNGYGQTERVETDQGDAVELTPKLRHYTDDALTWFLTETEHRDHVVELHFVKTLHAEFDRQSVIRNVRCVLDVPGDWWRHLAP